MEFRVCKAGDMDLFEEFDLFFSNSTVHWIKDHKTLWKKVYTGLKPGGVARFEFSGKGTATRLIGAFRTVAARKEYVPFFRDMSWPSRERILRKSLERCLAKNMEIGIAKGADKSSQAKNASKSFDMGEVL